MKENEKKRVLCSIVVSSIAIVIYTIAIITKMNNIVQFVLASVFALGVAIILVENCGAGKDNSVEYVITTAYFTLLIFAMTILLTSLLYGLFS